jgi:photosynthetic reaction center H subunit
MQAGAITSHIDVAQIALYAFWLFFFGLIYYLRREDKREGYPLESNRGERVTVQGFPAIPPQKTFLLPHGGVQTAPRTEPRLPVSAVPVYKWPGAPLEPVGNPMLSGAGPSAYANRSGLPDMMHESNEPKIVPLRVALDFHIDAEDPDPRGMTVIGCDGQSAGAIGDVWVDRSEVIVRYLEVALAGLAEPRSVLLPMTFAVVDTARRRIVVDALTASQFLEAPATASANQVTLREEDRITAYYAGGVLYAKPSRLGPVI